MRYLHILVLLFLIIRCRSSNEGSYQSYLSARLIDVKKNLMDSYNTKYRQNEIMLDIQSSGIENFKMNTRLITLELASYPYVYMKNKLYFVHEKDDTYHLQAHSIVPTIIEPVSFVKSINYQHRLFIIVATDEEHSNIYFFENNLWKFVQTINNFGKAVDAKFFLFYDNLYLFIVNQLGIFTVPSILYGWTGTHFDEIHRIKTESAVALTVFERNQEIILVIAQNPEESPKASILVFSFSGLGLRKLQYLKANTPKHLISFTQDDERYLIALNDQEESSIYLWDGLVFVQWYNFESFLQYHAAMFAYVEGAPTLFLGKSDSISVFELGATKARYLTTLYLNKYYKRIFNMHFVTSGAYQFLFIHALSVDDMPELIFMSLSIGTKIIENDYEHLFQENSLFYCLLSLEEKLELQDKVLDDLMMKSENFGPAKKIGSSTQSAKYQTDMNNFDNDIQSLQNNFDKLRQNVDTLQQNISNSVQNIIINGDLQADFVNIPHVSIEKINNQSWDPNNWLQLDKEQVISSPVTARNLVTKNLTVLEGAIVKKPRIHDGNQILTGRITLNSLKVNHIFANRINDVDLDMVYRINRPHVFQERKNFHVISAERLYVSNVNQQSAVEFVEKFKNPILVFKNPLHIRNLNVENVNEMNWNNFMESLFRKSQPNTIEGNLTINGDVEIKNLIVNSLYDIPIEDLFTISTDQEITSDFTVSSLNVNNILSTNINGVDFNQDVVTFKDQEFSGLISIKNMVIKNLNITNADIRDVNEKQQERLQIYDGHVQIIGNVQLGKVKLEDDAEFYLRSEPFTQTLEKFWLKSVDQVIGVDIFATNEITADNVKVNIINDIPVASLARIDHDTVLESVTFDNLVVQNISTNVKSSIIERLYSETIKKSDSFNVSGIVTFNNAVRIDDLETNLLNDMKVENFVTTNYSGMITGVKTFSEVIVRDDINFPNKEDVIIHKINGIMLDYLMNNTLFTNKPITIDQLNMTDADINNLNIEEINRNSWHKINLSLYDARPIHKVHVTGDVNIEEIVNVLEMNQINVPDYFGRLIRKNADNDIFGNIKFANVTTNSLFTGFINNVNIDKLVGTYLSRSSNQTINHYFFFQNILCSKISVPKINNFEMSEIIDVQNDGNIHIHRNLILDNLIVRKSINSQSFNCDMKQLMYSLRHIPPGSWDKVIVDGNVMVYKNTGKLSRLLHDTVISGISRSISGSVTINHMSVYRALIENALIGNVNITHLFFDSVLLSAEHQIIYAPKNISTITSKNVLVLNNAWLNIINDIPVSQLGRIIQNDRFDGVVYGHKTFIHGLEIGNLKLNSPIHGVLPENLISRSGVDFPNTHFTNLTIRGNLDVKTINSYNLNHVLSNRVLLDSDEPQIFLNAMAFDHISLSGPSTMVSINDISIDEIIVDTEIQYINSPKTFRNAINVEGNIYIGKLNGFNVTDEYQTSLLVDTDILQDIRFEQPVNFEYIHSEHINSRNISKLIESLNFELNPNTRPEISDIVRRLNMVVDDVKPQADDSVYLYLESAYDIQISIPRSVNAHIEEIKGSIILNVVGKEPGPECGLKVGCSCPVQHSFQLTAQMTHETMVINETNRLYSFYTSKSTVNVYTSSVSTSSFCRLQQNHAEKELTRIVWTIPTSLFPFSFPLYNSSYISGVKFFEHNDHVYVIITSFYDPIRDTNNLDCTILKLSESNASATIVQQIPTQGATAVELFRAPQGITLIIGNVYDSDKNTSNVNAEIYRFNETMDKFNLLNWIPTTGCHSAVGVVLNAQDSLIVLAERLAPVKAYKYDAHQDNYIFFQNVNFKYPVLGVSAFYVGDKGRSDVFLVITTYTKDLYLYSFKYIEGWKLESNGNIDGLQTLIPFTLNKQPYLFAPSLTKSKVLTIIKQGKK